MTSHYLKPNKNCNLTSWVSGCEPGWACSAGEEKTDMKNSNDMPIRTEDCQPCCEGFFCPTGLTCMIRKFGGIINPLNFSELCESCFLHVYVTASYLSQYCLLRNYAVKYHFQGHFYWKFCNIKTGRYVCYNLD